MRRIRAYLTTVLLEVLEDERFHPGSRVRDSGRGDALAEALLDHRPLASTPWTIDQRPARSSEVGRLMHDCDPHPVGLIRSGQRHWGLDAARLHVAREDVLVFLRTHTLTGN